MAERKQVFGMSGHCRFPTRDGGSHRTCHERWVTPSSEVTCECACHLSTRPPARVAKKVRKQVSVQTLTPKKRKA